MSWSEIIISFRNINYIISGGKPNERHIMTKTRYLLSIFLKCINIISIDNKQLNSVPFIFTNLYKYNNNEFMKYISSNIDLTNIKITDEIIYNKIDYFKNYDVSKELNNEINEFKDLKIFIDKLYLLLNTKINKNDLILLIKKINDIDKNELIDLINKLVIKYKN
jgi:hypothetical protein